MATVISTYVTQRHVRTADDIVREVSDEESSDSRPKPQNKITWGSLTDGPEKTVARLKKAVDQRLPQGNELVCILDGERSLWALVYAYFPAAFFVLDIFHVLEHLGKAALCFHDEGSPQAREFVTERLRMLLQGKAGRMIGGLKQMLTKHELSERPRSIAWNKSSDISNETASTCATKSVWQRAIPSAVGSLKGHAGISSTTDWNSPG